MANLDGKAYTRFYRSLTGNKPKKLGDASRAWEILTTLQDVDVCGSVARYPNYHSAKDDWNSERLSPSSVKKIGPLYFDFDGKDGGTVSSGALDRAVKGTVDLIEYLVGQGLREGDFRVWMSGGYGFHVEINPEAFRHSAPVTEWEERIHAMAMAVKEAANLHGMDESVYSKKRLWRLPGSKHGKTGLYKVEVPPDHVLNFLGIPDPMNKYILMAEKRQEDQGWPSKVNQSERLASLWHSILARTGTPDNIRSVTKECRCLHDLWTHPIELGQWNTPKMFLVNLLHDHFHDRLSPEEQKEIARHFARHTAPSHQKAEERETEVVSAYTSLVENGNRYNYQMGGCRTARPTGRDKTGKLWCSPKCPHFGTTDGPLTPVNNKVMTADLRSVYGFTSKQISVLTAAAWNRGLTTLKEIAAKADTSVKTARAALEKAHVLGLCSYELIRGEGIVWKKRLSIGKSRYPRRRPNREHPDWGGVRSDRSSVSTSPPKGRRYFY